MSKFRISYLVLFIAAVIIIFESFLLLKPNNENQTIKYDYQSLSINDSVDYDMQLQTQCENDAFKLKNAVVFYGNDSTSSFHLFNAQRKGSYLVFRFSGLYCDKCINGLVAKLKTTFPDFEKNDRIILLCSETSQRIKVDYYGKKTMSYLTEDMSLPFEKSSTPFLFVIDEDHVAKTVFIPNTKRPELTDKYLRLIKHRFLL